MITSSHGTKVVVDGPWRWWRDASHLAPTIDNHRLVGPVFLVASLFNRSIYPKMNVADQMETDLDRPSGYAAHIREPEAMPCRTRRDSGDVATAAIRKHSLIQGGALGGLHYACNVN